ncbi:MAG: pirin family protein [Deltaproteobacteria bacterium]|nr:pirin family protein [Deltaproteobacteria bacterium]
MIAVRRAEARHLSRLGKTEVWHTFSPEDRTDALADGFGSLEVFDEDRVAPGARVPGHVHLDVEIVTYVCEGGLAYQDSMGRSGVIRAGEFQRITAGRGIHCRERNASRADWAHVFQLWLRPAERGLAPGHEVKRFSAAQRRGWLCLVASPDARRGSLRIHQDALLYSAMLDPGQHVAHELGQGRSAWLHLVRGEATLGELVLTTGDGAGVTAERAVSLTAMEETELLFLDLGERQSSTKEVPDDQPTMPRSGCRAVPASRNRCIGRA